MMLRTPGDWQEESHPRRETTRAKKKTRMHMARLSRRHSPCSWNAGEQEGMRRLQNSALPDIKGLELRGTQPQLCQHWGSTFCLSALIVFSLFQKHNRGMWYKIKSKLQTTLLWKGSLSLHAPAASSAPHPSPVRLPESSTSPHVRVSPRVT